MQAPDLGENFSKALAEACRTFLTSTLTLGFILVLSEVMLTYAYWSNF